MRRILAIIFALGLVALVSALSLTAPRLPLTAAEFTPSQPPDATRGERVFTAGGCASCHAAPGAEGTQKIVLTGGRAFASDFGTFYAPNISFGANSAGIAEWSVLNLADALRQGVSPDGQHYYPAFPYTSYRNMTDQDVADLYAYLQTLPASDAPNRPHDVGFPFNIRRSLGGWKLLFFREGWVAGADTPELERGRYLVEALGHCAECHTPRNALGGLDIGNWMAGSKNPAGNGAIPALTPDRLGWTADDVAYFLETGFTPDFDAVGGEMADVVENTAALTDEDRAAIAAYLLALPD